MSGLGVRLIAAFEEAALAGRRRWGQGLLTVLASGLTLTFPVLLLIGLGWVGELFERLAEQERTRVFLTRDAGPAEVQALLALIDERLPEGEIELVQPEQARRRFLERYPELAGIAAGLSPDDLRFPSGIEYRPPPEPERAAALAREVAGRPGVDEVRHDAAWALTLQRLERSARLARALVALLALAVAGFGIGNVVSLGALSRREELSVMRLVGAPRFHVRAPFWILGFVQGALGGLLAAALCAVVSSAAAPRLAALLPTARPGPEAAGAFLLALAAGAAGAAGAGLGVEAVLRRHARLER
jgi:cell division transport system permease protein